VLSRRDRVLGGLWGALVGDALGVPVEFVDRTELRRDPVTGLREYGTYLQPKGAWSDDSSLLLCTVESLLAGFDTADLGRHFVRWRSEGHWTPWGRVFDIGITTCRALRHIAEGGAPEEAHTTDRPLLRRSLHRRAA
jgi:ADP-ribosylglycohydrolase